MSPLVVQIITIVFGIVLMILSFNTYVHKKISVTVCMSWCLAGIFLILIAAIPGVSRWTKVLCTKDCLVLFVMMLAFILVFFKMSMLVSQVIHRNQELAMQVALLNQENENILLQIKELKQKNEENIIRD